MKSPRIVLAAFAAFALTACSGIKTFEFPIHGLEDQNRNAEGKPSPVQVRILQLCGQSSADAFSEAQFGSVWRTPVESDDVEVVGKARKVNVRPGTTVEVELAKVPVKVTHIGLLARFEQPQPGKDRLVVPKGEIEDLDLALRGYAIVDRNTDPKESAPAPTPSGSDGQRP